MKAVFYTITDNKNVIGKNLLNGVEKNINIKSSTEILNPTISLILEEYPKFNYCYLERFNRYYFIDNVNVTPHGFYQLSLKVDVLETYKTDILNSKGLIVRNKNNNKFYDVDTKTEVKKECDIYNSDITLNNEETQILISVGGA